MSNLGIPPAPSDQDSLMTPTQQAYYNQLLEQLSGYSPEQSYEPNPFTGFTPYQERSGVTSAYDQMLSGRPAYEINPEITEQYYRQNIYDPAMYEYENVTRPGFLESMGTLHSGARANMEMASRENLARQLRGERSALYYADEQSRRQAAEAAAQRQMATALGIGQQDTSRWQSENELAMQQWGAENMMNLQAQQFASQQQALPYQLLMQALGMPATENIVQQDAQTLWEWLGF